MTQKAVKGLWLKEWKMTRVFHFFVILLSMTIAGISYWSLADNGLEFVIMPVVIVMVLHIFYFPGYLLYSLARESGQLHLWLHTPQSIHKLVGMKIINGVIFLIVSLGLITSFAYWLVTQINAVQPYVSDLFRVIFLVDFHILLYSVYLGLFIYFLWTLFQMMKNYLGRFNWVVIIALFITLPIALGWFTDTTFFFMLTGWGQIDLTIHQMFPELAKLPGIVTQSYSLYLGRYVFDIMVALFLYVAASYLMDRKVEV